MPAKPSDTREDLRKEAQALAEEMARDMLMFSRAAWRMAADVGKLGLRAAEDIAGEAEKTWEKQRGRSKQK
jgi:hypothetical protein